MKGGVSRWDDAEQALREFVVARKAEFAFRQRIERLRWEKDVLGPEVDQVKQEILDGQLPQLVLSRGA